MAFKKKTVEPTVEITSDETEEVTLADLYADHTGLLYNSNLIEFTQGKATVRKSTAVKLRELGFVK
jgi:hypothetical protein